jgi:hypothetical protein
MRIKQRVLLCFFAAIVGAIALLLWRNVLPHEGHQFISDKVAFDTARRFEPAGLPLVDDNGNLSTDATPRPVITLSSQTMSFDFDGQMLSVNQKFFPTEPERFYGADFQRLLASGQRVSRASAFATAKFYALEHFRNSKMLNGIRLRKPYDIKVDGSGRSKITVYPFQFYYDPGGISISPCRCTVFVDSLAGRVVSYVEQDTSITTSPKPSISIDKAESSALRSLVVDGKEPQVKELDILDPDLNGEEKLAYLVTFSGKGPAFDQDYIMDERQTMFKPMPWYWNNFHPTQQNKYWAAIDAHSGEFLGWGFASAPPWKPGEFR